MPHKSPAYVIKYVPTQRWQINYEQLNIFRVRDFTLHSFLTPVHFPSCFLLPQKTMVMSLSYPVASSFLAHSGNPEENVIVIVLLCLVRKAALCLEKEAELAEVPGERHCCKLHNAHLPLSILCRQALGYCPLSPAVEGFQIQSFSLLFPVWNHCVV